MAQNKTKISLLTINAIFFTILFVFASDTNTKGAHAESWMVPIIMLFVGLLGALIGTVIGWIVGVISRPFGKKIIMISGKVGGTIGFILLLLFWYTSCLSNGTAVCLPQ